METGTVCIDLRLIFSILSCTLLRLHRLVYVFLGFHFELYIYDSCYTLFCICGLYCGRHLNNDLNQGSEVQCENRLMRRLA